MKKRILTALVLSCLLFLLCLLCVGCAKEVRSGLNSETSDGEMEIGFFVKYSLVGMSLKSESDDIEDINLYLVNETGDVVSFIYLSGNDSDSRMGASIRKWERYTVYAVANAGKRMPAASLEEIMKLEYELPEGDIDVSGGQVCQRSVLMAGRTEPQMLYNGAVVWINIERCISRIVLKADYSGLNDDVEIEVKSISLKNVPRKVRIFGESRIEDPEFSSVGAKVTELSKEILEQGVAFYQYENMQGTLQPDNDDCTKKVWPQESVYSKICSYVELEASYSSPRKKGDILYRFYLGSDMTSNYDVPRNTSQTVTVSFKGDGAVDENTWRVDDSYISNLVTRVEVNPSAHRFIGYGSSIALETVVLPEDAAEKRLAFRSTDERVAVVDNFGNVTSVGEGECLVIAESCDGTAVSDTCAIVVCNPNIAFAQKGRVMYDGEVVRVPYDVLSPAGADVELLLSNGNAQITACDAEGFTVKALTAGTCVVTARVGAAKADYELDIQKLSIVLKEKSAVAYNHFYYDFEYTVTPEHAAGLGVRVVADSRIASHVELCGGNRILVSVDNSLEYPRGVYDFTVEVEGRGDVCDKAQLSVAESSLSDVRMVPNLNARSAVASLDFATSPRAFASMRDVSGVPALEFVLDAENSTVSAPVPCSLNGRYGLNFMAVGDDGRQVTMEAGLEIYEAVYVVAVSKQVSVDKVSQRPLVWEYVNEVALKLLSYPGSCLFEEGELIGGALPEGVALPGFEYRLDGKVCSDLVPDICFTRQFTFRSNDEYAQFPSGTYVYDGGDVPEKYIEFYPIDILQPWVVLPGNRYIYLYNRVFGGGFCDEATDWTEILDIVY